VHSGQLDDPGAQRGARVFGMNKACSSPAGVICVFASKTAMRNARLNTRELFKPKRDQRLEQVDKIMLDDRNNEYGYIWS